MTQEARQGTLVDLRGSLRIAVPAGVNMETIRKLGIHQRSDKTLFDEREVQSKPNHLPLCGCCWPFNEMLSKNS